MSDIATVAGRPGRLIVASLKPGAQLTSSIEEVCREYEVETAVITSIEVVSQAGRSAVARLEV